MEKGYADTCTDLDLLTFEAEYQKPNPERKPEQDQAETENKTDYSENVR
ncbi:MAG: hypothetical protein ACLFVE_11350 [Chitinispirillaceae bacterium]